MVELSTAKTYGGIGALLLLIGGFIPYVGFAVSIVGLILIFLGVKTISEITNDEEIYKNFILSFIFNIIAIVSLFGILLIGFGATGGFSWLTSLETAEITDFTTFWNYFGGIVIAAIIGLLVAWIFAILGSIYLRKSYKSITNHTNIKHFETAGTMYLIGSITAVILIGFILLFIARIIEIVAFFSLPDTLASKEKMTNERRCPNCGRIIPFDAKVCPYCAKHFSDQGYF